MAPLVAILLLLVSAACEENDDWAKEQKLISIQLKSEKLEGECKDMVRHYCNETGRNSFLLQTRGDEPLKKVWLESFRDIVKDIETIHVSADVKQMYQSIINSTFNALNDLLNDYYKLDNRIKELSPIKKSLDDIQHRIQTTFTTTEEIPLLIEIVKDFIFISKIDFKDSNKINILTKKIMIFVRAIHYNAVTYVAYQPLIKNLTNLLSVVSTKGKDSTKLPALGVLLNNTIDEFKKIAGRASVHILKNGTENERRETIKQLSELKGEFQEVGYDYIKKQQILKRKKTKDTLLNIRNKLTPIIQNVITVIVQKPTQVNKLSDLLKELRKLSKDSKNTLDGNEDVKEVLKLIEDLIGFVQKIESEWTNIYHSSNFHDTIKKVTDALQDLNREIQRGLDDNQKILKIIESFATRREIIIRVLAKNKQLREIPNKLITIIKSFMTSMATKPSTVKDFNEIIDKNKKLQEELKNVVNESQDGKVVSKLIENIQNIFEDIVQLWNEVNPSSEIDDTIKKLTSVVREIIEVIQESGNNFQKIKQTNESFNKRKEKIKSILRDSLVTEQKKHINEAQNKLVNIIKNFITVIDTKTTQVNELKDFLDEITKLKDFKVTVKDNQDVKEFFKLVENLSGVVKNIVEEWPSMYQSNDTIKRVTTVLEELNREIPRTSYDLQTITKINKAFDKRIEIIKSSLDQSKQLSETRNKIINIIKSFISLLAQKPTEVKQFNGLLVELTKHKEDLKTVKGNEHVKEVFKLLEKLTGFVKKIVSEWTIVYQSSNFDNTIKKVISVLEELNREVQKTSNDFPTITIINDSFDKDIETMKSSLDEIKLLSETRNKIINLIKSFITVLAQQPSEVKKFNDVLNELSKLKEDLKTVEGNEDVKEILKLLENLTGFVQKIVSEWTNIYQSSNFDDTIKKVNIVLEEITKEIQSSSKDFKTIITKINNSFDKRIEIIKSSMTTSRQLVDTRNKIINIVKGFISVLAQKPSDIKRFNDLLVELKKFKEDVITVKGNEDVKEVLKLLENLTGFVQKIVSEWTTVYQSSNFDDTINKVTIVLEELTREIQSSSRDFQTIITKINQSFNKRIEIIKSAMATSKQLTDTRNKLINIIKSFISVLSQKPSDIKRFNDLLVELKKFKEDLNTLMGNEDVKDVSKLLENLTGFVQKIVSEWTTVYQSPNFDDTINKVTIVLEEITREIQSSSRDFQTIIKKINQSFNKRIEIIKSPMAKSKQLIDTRNKLINIIKSFISVLAQKPSDIKRFNDLLVELKKIKEDLIRLMGNEDVKEVLKLVENLTGFAEKIVSEWTTVYQSSNFDDTINKVTIVLEEITREIQSSSRDFKTIITKINQSFNKRIEIIKSSMATFKQLIDTRNKIINIIKSIISVLAQKPSEIKRFNDLLFELKKLKEDLNAVKGNEDVNEMWKLLENLTGFVQQIVSEWTNIYQSSNFDDTINKVTIVLEEVNEIIRRSSKDFQTIIKRLNEKFDKRIENIINSIATIKQLIDTRNKIINIIKSFISVLAQNASEVKKFNDLLVEITKVKEDLNKVKENKDVKGVLKLLDNLAGFIQKTMSEWTNIYQSSGFDDTVKKVTIVLEELNGEIIRSSNYFQTITKINESIDKRIEIIKSSVAHIKQPIETRKKIINIIKTFISVLAQNPTQVKKLNDVFNELTKLKEDLKTVKGNVDVMEVLKLLETLTSLVQVIASEWTIVSESSNFDDTINKVKTFLEDLSKEIQRSLSDKEKMIRVNEVFAKRIEIIKRILDRSKQLKDARYKLIPIIKGFIAVMARKPSSINEFNDIFGGIRTLQEDLKKKVTGNNDLKVVLELIENIRLIFQDILQQWNKVYQSQDYEDTFKKMTSILEELNREIQENRNDYQKIKKLNESFSKRKDKIKTVLKKLNKEEKFTVYIQGFLKQISAKLPDKEEIIELISEIASVDKEFRQSQVITTEKENYLMLTEKFIALLKDVLKIWDYLHSSGNREDLYQEVSQILQDITQFDKPGLSNEDYIKRMTTYLNQITNIFLKEESKIPTEGHSSQTSSPLVHILRDIQKLAEEEDSSLSHFNTLLREIKSFYDDAPQSKDLKQQIGNIYLVFKALTPIIKVNTDSKIEETFIWEYRHLFKTTGLD
ncbi:unnamed protein product [Lymnaea stagnalis]|uniref:Uncharacterized protein n=1 Tax=Lymnaea stagnalis TaxID=6523 RepID=A0AAV2HY10_LYMST